MGDTVKAVSTKYNIILFSIYVVFQSIISILEYEDTNTTLLDRIFEQDFAIGVLILFFLFAVAVPISIWVVRSFWERFVSRLFHVRQITVNEAISIILVFMILTAN